MRGLIQPLPVLSAGRSALLHIFRRQLGHYVLGAKTVLISFDPIIPFLGIYPKKIIKSRKKFYHGRIHSEIIHDSKMC
jgi:hypothetical protein